MSKTITDTIASTGGGDGETLQLLVTTTNVNSPGAAIPLALSAGDNLFGWTNTTTNVTIVPSNTSANAKTYRTVSGDTGMSANPAAPFRYAPAVGATPTMYIHSAGSEIVMIYLT